MRILNAWVAALAGMGVTVGLAHFGIPWATVAIGTGATITAVLLLVRRGGRKYYALAGTVFCLGIALAFGILDGYADTYHQDVVAVGLGLGIVSGIIVTAQWTGEQIVKWVMAGKAGEEGATAIYNAIAAIIGLISMVWTVLTAYEKAGRYGGVGLTGASGLALNLIGARIPIPIWFIDGGVDASIVLFVGAVLIGFHSLESIHTTWHAMKVTGKGAASAGKKGAGMVSGRIQSSDGSTVADSPSNEGTHSKEASHSDIKSTIHEGGETESEKGVRNDPGTTSEIRNLDYSAWVLLFVFAGSGSTMALLPVGDGIGFRVVFGMIILFSGFLTGVFTEGYRFIKSTAFGYETSLQSTSNFAISFVTGSIFAFILIIQYGSSTGSVVLGGGIGLCLLIWYVLLSIGGF